MAHLPLRRTRADDRRLQHEFCQVEHRFHPIIIVKEPQVTYDISSQIMSYILNILIYVCMILIDNLLQCLLFIVVIDLYRTCDDTIILICNSLVMFMIYPSIKIKLKVLIFSTIQKSYCRHFSFIIDLLKLAPFTGVNFKRWQMRITL
jgi:hypothetical protein